MHLNTLTLLLLSTIPFIAAAPLTERADGPGKAYQCTPKGSGAARKKKLESEGANAQDLAITIEETGCNMSGTSYPYGDSSPGGAPKTGDSANFGLFKNNWGMIRSHCSQFRGQTTAQWRNGAVLNTNDAEAIKCQHEQIAALGTAGFYYSQRGGGSAEAADYTNAINYVENYLKQGHLSDDWVTYYTLHAI